MLMLISPSKKLDETPFDISDKITPTKPDFLGDAEELVEILQGYTPSDIIKLMGVSDAIAELNCKRYADFKTPFTKENAKAALYLFKGDVYDAMDTASYGKAELDFAQSHLRILSGLYGVLRPCDLMQSYRLEMGKNLENERGKNLYEFWGERVTDSLNDALEETGSRIVLNLASNEYFKVVKPKNLAGELLTIDFKEEKDGNFKTIGLFTKRARGMMADFIIKNKVTETEILKSFNMADYAYNASMSDGTKITFTRKQPIKKAA